MEPAKIDWNTLESFFVIDQVYENINAPQWVDFLAPHHHSPDYDHDDDQAWFCRPDCKHPKTAEDFLKSTPSKLLRSVSVSKLIGDWTRRDANLKRRGAVQTQSNEDTTENQNPNFCTPPPNQHKTKAFFKTGIKSSAQKTPQEKEEEDEYSEILLHSEEKQQPKPRLRSTQSARDLFGGKDIFNKITDFCSELKKMATWAKEKEIHDQNPVEVRKKENVLGSVSEKKMEQRDNNKQRKPFSKLRKEGCQTAGEKSNTSTKKKIQKKKILDGDDDEAENIPVSLNLNMKEVKRKEEERLLPIRTNPPTPQGFSATHPAKATPSKGTKSRLKERDIFQELEQNRTLREELGAKNEASPMAGREARGGALDVFWFLKPCTLST